MKTIEALWSQTASTARELNIQYGAGQIKYDLTIPKGTLCVNIGCWVVHDLSWLDRKSIVYHDADHYGIPVAEKDLVDIKSFQSPHFTKN